MRTLEKPTDSYIDLVERARSIFPGCTNTAVSPAPGYEVIADRGAGVYLYDIDGRRWLDFALGSGPLIHGHAHPRIIETIKQASNHGTHHFTIHRRAIELAERISKYVPCAEMVRYMGTGNEATFNAIRLARAATGRDSVIKFDGAFHGHHDMVSASFERSPTDSPNPYFQSAGIQNGVRDTLAVLPFNDTKALTELLKANADKFAAVICEPFQRMIAPLPGFLETLREMCDKTGTVLIFDEVVTGFRLAPGGAQEFYGVLPDLVTLGKALSGGMSIAALCGKRNLMQYFDPQYGRDNFAFHCGTLNGNALAVEAAHTCLDLLIEEGGIHHLTSIGEYTRDRMARTLKDANLEYQIVGEGPLFHAYFTSLPVQNNADVIACDWKFSDRLHELLFSAGVYKPSVKGYLGTVHQTDHIDELVNIIEWAIPQM